MIDNATKQLTCPYCGYKMPVFYSEITECKELSLQCKGRNCKKLFKVHLKQGIDIGRVIQ